jgi:hypothetical protein
MENDFFKYICSLAPEGETALIVKQIDTGKLYLDGTIKYTWPAYMPTHKRKSGEAWFINTGSFIVDRFRNGKPSASTANCEHVLFMMLDDIGTKSKTPPLEPTWIIETSPGNFQWGYVYSEQPTTGEHCAAITAIARAGYSDPGATNAVRNCRLPGSTNQKPGRDSFEARLIEFSRKEYTLAEICAALDVVPDEASTAKYISYSIKDTGKDNVLTWLNEQSLVLSNVNPEGWLGIVCPNNHEHTDGNIGARYKPIDRSFCCYHGHCTDKIKSAEFLKWVCDNGGPDEKHGLRDDVLIAEMQEMNAKLPPNTMFQDDAQHVIEEVERRQAGRVTREKWFDRFAYITSDDAFFDLESRNEMSRGVFNAVFRHVECNSVHGKKPRRIEAATWFDEHREDKRGTLLKGLTYAAGEKALVYNSDGDVYGNRWVDARPIAGAGDVSRWLKHAEALVPNVAEREHIFNVMAFKLQHPEIKINHAVLHGGDEGCGKDTLWAPFIWGVCGVDQRNRGLIDSDNLQSQWGYALESEILILNELREPEAKERRALANRLKPIIAAPPETLPINRKGLHPYDMVNRLFVLAFTNDPVPITLPTQDRRWFCIWSRSPRMLEAEARAMWDWYKSGGFEAIAGWLYARDVSKFNPAATPMETEFKRTMISSGMSTAESYILDEIQDRRYPFNKGVVGGPWFKVCNQLANAAPPGVKVPQSALLHALKEAGWKDLGMIDAPEYRTKKHVFVSPEMAYHKKSELRRMVEDEIKEGNVINLRS